MTSKNNEDGIRDRTNDMSNAIIYIDKVGLEDLITFREAEFEIVDGYLLMMVEMIQSTKLLDHYTIKY